MASGRCSGDHVDLYPDLALCRAAYLASTSVPVLLVAGVGVATLLLPLYQFMARSCWQYGSEAVFDPVRWCAAVVKVHREIAVANASRLQAMLMQSADTQDRRADSDPQDNGAADP